ncbi:MAG: ATP-binding protein [Gemmataceae bacterium]|nr:adenine nucleotide alpha hydrolase [Gemmata sp.]MDW8198499.1 ATP-binding protein [Gemmataceae bacterium]
MKAKALVSWSSGKDSAWTLHVLRQQAEVEVVGLLTTYNEVFDRVAMHGVRRELVEAQAAAAGLPLWLVPLPSPCSNDVYEERMRAVVERAKSHGITAIAFGDLFLADIRAYRERQLSGTGITPLFPLWNTAAATHSLAHQMLAGGLKAALSCVDPQHLSPSQFVGREFDYQLLEELPAGVDPCGEKGEFHTICYAGPMFTSPLAIRRGDIVERQGFWFCDFVLDEARGSSQVAR